MLTALRLRIQAALQSVPAVRRPALRRCDATDALLATNLPFVAEEADVSAFTAVMEASGVRVMPRGGWLLLDAPVPAPEAAIPPCLVGEAGCCISLLLRHGDNGPAQDADEVIRAIVKASEAGKQPFERLCTQLHADFAARLRQHSALPTGALPYLCAACEKNSPS